MSWRRIRRSYVVVKLSLLILLCIRTEVPAAEDERPNILFAIADDWGWPHAGAYGEAVVQTPTFDSIAKRGLLFENAFVSSPSCTPSRGAILTGQWHWRLAGAANLHGVFPDEFETYPELLAADGYRVGHTGKAWGPGRPETKGRNLAGRRFPNFAKFLEGQSDDQPFCFWLGSSDPHRPYKEGSGEASGMNLDEVRLPACFPNAIETRRDVADYYFEVQRFDRLVGDAIKRLEAIGKLENTIVVMTGDHGMPFPRGKSNLYDTGTHVPLAIMWPRGQQAVGRRSTDFVSLCDIAPTFLEAARLEIPGPCTGRSLLSIVRSKKEGRVEADRDFVLVGKERHVVAQEGGDMGGYPCRGLRTDAYLLIINHRPDRWPSGTPNWEEATKPKAWLADCDNGLTKWFMYKHRDDDETNRRLYDLAFAKRPAVELYDLAVDPHQLNNVAAETKYTATAQRLKEQLKRRLKESGDPRELSEEEPFDHYPYTGGAPRFPGK